jgi:Protein of unknown function (DUF3667)
MAGEFDAAGTAIEGALLGAAVEEANRALGSSDKQAEDAVCLNCGARLSGPFCAACGQQAHVHRTLSAIWHDILHSVLHFDGKFWRTLPLLVFKPGELTRRYVHGERAKFVSPMAIFLFSIFLMFAVFSFTGGSAFGGVNSDYQKEMAAEAASLDKQIAESEALIASGEMPAAAAAALTARVETMKAERNGIAYATTGKPIYVDAGAKRNLGDNASISAIRSDTGWKWLDDTLNKGGVKMVQNPSLTFYKLQSNGYKFAWLLIPLSLPFVWLATLGARGRRFYDHAVFTTYSISFMCLLFLAVAIAARIGVSDGILGLVFVIVPPIHIYKQLRYAYGFSRGSTFVRLCLLMISIVIIMALFAMTLLFLGLLG